MKIILLFISTSIFFTQDLDELYFGDDETLDIITWNIEYFPKNGSATIDYVRQIINYLDVDIIAMQELDDIESFNQMLSNLENYQGYYESSWFAGLAYIYNPEKIEINDIYEIYTTSEFWSAFPRSPMVMDMNFMGKNYIIINNHYKCCGDGNLNFNNTGDEETRRYIANNLLKQYIDNYFADNNVILLGDLNDDIAEASNNNVFQMFLDDTNNYLFADLEIAEGSSADWSFPNWPSHLDHILITNELFDDFEYVEVIKIDYFLDGGFSQYDQNISDHRPVGIKFSSSIENVGDINSDSQVNVVDIVLLVDIVLDNSSEFNNSADLNVDGIINILDIVQLVSIILS